MYFLQSSRKKKKNLTLFVELSDTSDGMLQGEVILLALLPHCNASHVDSIFTIHSPMEFHLILHNTLERHVSLY